MRAKPWTQTGCNGSGLNLHTACNTNDVPRRLVSTKTEFGRNPIRRSSDTLFSKAPSGAPTRCALGPARRREAAAKLRFQGRIVPLVGPVRRPLEYPSALPLSAAVFWTRPCYRVARPTERHVAANPPPPSRHDNARQQPSAHPRAQGRMRRPLHRHFDAHVDLHNTADHLLYWIRPAKTMVAEKTRKCGNAEGRRVWTRGAGGGEGTDTVRNSKRRK